MLVKILNDQVALGAAAAQQAAAAIRRSTSRARGARIVAATGASQFTFLKALTETRDIDWSRVELFHLDEYIGLSIDHPASFRKYLLDRLINKVGIGRYHLLDGEAPSSEVLRDIGDVLNVAPIDVAFVGIGENGHLAFNDPPADFETEEPYLVVTLDERCRRQQLGEGWFSDLSEVPRQAISMSIRQILKSEEIVCIVPEARKAQAVKACLEGDITPMSPASILRSHPNTTLYLDKDSASLLNQSLLSDDNV